MMENNIESLITGKHSSKSDVNSKEVFSRDLKGLKINYDSRDIYGEIKSEMQDVMSKLVLERSDKEYNFNVFIRYLDGTPVLTEMGAKKKERNYANEPVIGFTYDRFKKFVQDVKQDFNFSNRYKILEKEYIDLEKQVTDIRESKKIEHIGVKKYRELVSVMTEKKEEMQTEYLDQMLPKYGNEWIDTLIDRTKLFIEDEGKDPNDRNVYLHNWIRESMVSRSRGGKAFGRKVFGSYGSRNG